MAEVNNVLSIDGIYEDFLNKATISEDQIDQLNKTLEENISEENQLLRDIQNGNNTFSHDTDEKLSSRTAKVYIDPETGKVQNVEDVDTENHIDEVDLDDLLSMTNDEFKETSIKKENIFKSIKEQFGDEIPDTEIYSFISVLNRYKSGEKFGFFKEMPPSIQKIINESIVTNGTIGPSISNNQIRNIMSKEIMDSVLTDNFMESVFTDFDNSIKEAYKEQNKEITKEFSEYNIETGDIIKNKFLELANKVEEENPEKAALLRRCSKNYVEAYTYNDMKNMYRETNKLKAKKIDLDKFNRVCNEFNFKYKNTKMVINDISNLSKILKRHLPKYCNTEENIKRFIIAFCKYTRNMKADNIDEHIFMYYFIKNIINLDFYDKDNKEASKFHDNLINNIITMIGEINTKENNSNNSN